MEWNDYDRVAFTEVLDVLFGDRGKKGPRGSRNPPGRNVKLDKRYGLENYAASLITLLIWTYQERRKNKIKSSEVSEFDVTQFRTQLDFSKQAKRFWFIEQIKYRVVWQRKFLEHLISHRHKF